MFAMVPAAEISYEERHAALVRYLQVKVQENDWHGVSDAANDLRVLEATRLGTEIGNGGAMIREGKSL